MMCWRQPRSWRRRRIPLPEEVISDLVRKALTRAAGAEGSEAAPHGLLYKDGWYVLPSRGAVVTNELIVKIQEELDQDDARAAGRERSTGSDG